MIKLIVSGRVGQDAEVKNVGDNTVCSFSVAHTEKVYGATLSEKTIWVTCSIWGERGIKLAPNILKGTYVVIEGSGSVNGYLNKNTGTAEAVIRCMVNSIEFGGKPTAMENAPKGYVNPLTNPVVQELKKELNVDEPFPF
jgi:single-strand DNA-binding protein